MAKKRNKLYRYTALSSMSSVFQVGNSDPRDLAGNWHDIFGNKNPIVLELACGKGDYTLSMAQMFPEKNFIGVDIKGARIFLGAKQAQTLHLPNVRFLRIYIDHISDYFAPGEVDELWITFPDPHPTDKGAKKRLTHPKFLEKYQNILKPTGSIRLKTDSTLLFDYTLDVLQEFHISPKLVLYNIDKATDIDPQTQSLLTIETYYESLHRKNHLAIHFLSFTLQHATIP